MRRHVVGFIVLAAVSIVAVVAAALYLLDEPDDVAQQASDEPDHGVVSGAGEADDPAGDALHGRPACPGVSIAGVELDCLADADGSPETTHLGRVDEGLSVINVWAWWCAPCREELPVFDELAARHPEITVAGVHADADPARGAQLLEDLGVELPSFSDTTGALQAQLGLPQVVPITLILRDAQVATIRPTPYADVDELESDLGLGPAGTR